MQKWGGCVVVMEGGIEMHLDDNPLRFRSHGVNFPSRDPYFFSDTSRRYWFREEQIISGSKQLLVIGGGFFMISIRMITLCSGI